jgi:hypothetical protein
MAPLRPRTEAGIRVGAAKAAPRTVEVCRKNWRRVTAEVEFILKFCATMRTAEYWVRRRLSKKLRDSATGLAPAVGNELAFAE